ncbi:NAD(P)H-hydrate dehydratase [Actinocrinis puniceicyclus]|uniref:Bifunctional NAD(P)H-hydrate repair enzyme n=1 Tax=Actinocrinis puniceicyclus TaxID=977794 RepID=A0A8J7WKS2_9ACTN|nr:NAD(P)H-hydrate dehydratase [Actinocrinis puniceicyclus]MBS2964141.1 NAD(P)H-hydrate dehydratase [Actinocrinis puniceicyclus]
MRRAYHVDEIRRAEADLMARLPDGALMQRAAAGLAAVAARILRDSGGVYGARVALLVGVGDNGGDALYAGAGLARRGARVRAVLLDETRVHAGGLAALVEAGGRTADETALDDAELIIDGMLGIGGHGGLRGRAAQLARAAADAAAAVLAVDLPSGIDADSGQVAGTCVRADATVTFGAYKPGLLIDPAAEHAGVVELVDIGLSALPEHAAVEALQAADVAGLLPRPSHATDKYLRGVVGVACGSVDYPGAGMLAVGGALRGGVGAVRYSGPRQVGEEILRRWPEVLVEAELPSAAGRVQAWVCGSGLPADDEYAAQRTKQVVDSALPAVLDAGALTYLDDLDLGEHIVLTPHAGEAARLLGVERAQVEANRLDFVRGLAAELGATVLLKGSTTLIAEPGGGAVRANPTGTAALATAGSGDVLAGLIGALLAAGLRPLDAASVGAYMHGLAGRLARREGPIAAGDLLASLPRAWHNLQ